MGVAGLSEAAASELIAFENLDEIEIAGINSQDNVTLSGNLAALERLGSILEPRGVFFRLLDLDYAFHSRSMDPIKDGLVMRLAALAPVSTTVAAFVSTVTGGMLDGTALDASYWWHNVRHPVRFAQAMSELAARGCRVFVEIGPHANCSVI